MRGHSQAGGTGGGSLRRDAAVCLAVCAVVAGVYVPMAATGSRLADQDDFLQLAARQEWVRKSLFVYGTFPLRSHFFGSGYPTLGDPEDPTLSPFTWLFLWCSPALALKLRVLVTAVLGAAGAFLLARRALGYALWGAAFSGLLFPLAAWLPRRVASGNLSETLPALLPLCLFLVVTAPRRPLRFVALPVLLATMLADGKQSFFSSLLFMGVACIGWCLLGTRPVAPVARNRWQTRVTLRERIHPLAYLAFGTAFTVLVAMVRILPALEVISATGGVSDLDLAFHGARAEAAPAPTCRQALAALVDWRAAGAWRSPLPHVGVIPALLFGAAVFLAWRQALVWAGAFVVFFWLLLGPRAPVDLLAVLQGMPLGGAFDRPPDFFAAQLTLAVALGAGACFRPLLAIKSRRLTHLLAAFSTAGMVLLAAPRAVVKSTENFVEAPVAAAPGRPADFYSVQGRGLRRNRAGPFAANAYFNLRRNVGTIDWYTGIPLPEHGQPRFFVDAGGYLDSNPDYSGEAHFARGANRAAAALEPTRIQVKVDVRVPDLLIVNQNFHPGWSTDRGRLEARDGLLAVRLEETGSYEVTLRYVSRPFTRGLVVSVAGFAALTAFVLLRRRGAFPLLGPAAASRPAGPSPHLDLRRRDALESGR